MGRYFNTSTGREGKFMVAVQSSTDPEYLGMHEEEPTEITYYADEADVKEITQKLNEQYDLLGVAKENRIYKLKADEEQAKWERECLHNKVWKTLHHEKDAEELKKLNKINWASDKGNDYVDVEIEDGRCLAYARIRLALVILSDIAEAGYCSLDAEL